MPTTEGGNADADNLLLRAPTGTQWAPGPNAQWKLIDDPVGSGKGFTRAAIERHIIAHHESVHGTDKGTHAVSAEWENAGRGHSHTTFYKKLPGEVTRYLEGNKAATRLFHVTQNSDEAGGADALADLGEDKYFAHVDRLHGSTLNAALDTARHSDDPEMKFAAMIHENIPDAAARKKLGSIDAQKLRVGQQFTYGGEPFRVIEDADGYKVLHGMGEDFPLDALKQVPIDRGSLKKAKAPKAAHDDIAPFSGADAGTDALWLHNPSANVRDALTLGQGLPTDILGQPVKHAWADALLCGAYRHPITGQQFSIDRQKLDGMVDSFRKMKDAGVKVPIVEDHKELAASSLGWVIDAKRDGDRLMLLHQFIGEDAARKAARNHVSLKINGKFTDGKGNVYANAFTHSALTPVPVIPNQQGFVAASRGPAANDPNTDGNVPDVFILAAPPSQRTKPMALTQEQVNRVRKLPGAAEVTDDGAADFLLSFAESANQNLPTLLSRAQDAEAALEAAKQTPDEAQIELSRVATERDQIAQERETLKTQITELSRRAIKPLDQEQQTTVMESVDVLASACVDAGALIPSVKDEVVAFCTKTADGKPNHLMLSGAANGNGNGPTVLGLLRILKKNRPVALGSDTGLQTLSRVAPGTEEDPKEKELSDVTARIVARANAK